MNARSRTEVMRSTTVSSVVPTTVAQTWQCVRDLVADFWRTEVLISDEPLVLLHSVLAEPEAEPCCWLTWTLTACESGTLVMLVDSEEADCAPPELHGLLLALLERCIQVVVAR